ncbi:MAG: protein-export chaperone SecB [Rickettsiales bacterium]
MADAPATPHAPVAPARPGIALRAQYIKDLSFENPRAPSALFSLREPPQMEISVNIGVAKLEVDAYELVLHLNARAIADNATLFLCDLVYGGVFELHQIPESEQEIALFVQGASLLFPFARRVIAEITRDGGFPPLQLDPMDFASLYAQGRITAPAA